MGGGGKGGGSKSYIIGYKYKLGMHIGLVHEADAVRAIKVGEKLVWCGWKDGGSISINEPNVFGGEKREGGVVGTVDILMGASTQGQNSYLRSQLGSLVPAFRGIVSAVLRQVYLAAMNPYIKAWGFLLSRTQTGWYDESSHIGPDMNPAHIIHNCLTNAEWGLGYSESALDLTSFRAAADILYDEAFGLSMLWSAQDPMEDFIADVLRHIDGMLYVHPTTGLWTLKLLRDDYDPATVPVMGTYEIHKIISYSRLGYAERCNQLTLKYKEVIWGLEGENCARAGTVVGEVDRTISARNPAARSSQGQIIAETVEYPGITNGALAARVATRDVLQRSAVLAQVTFEGKRDLTKLALGGVFKWVWPEFGFTAMYMRVTATDYGTPTDKYVTITAIQDFFRLPDAAVIEPTATGWSNPVSEPTAPTYQQAMEAPYYTLIVAVVGDVPAIQEAYDPKGGAVTIQAAKPTQDALGFDIYTNVGGNYEKRGDGYWCPTALLQSSVDAVTTTFAVTSISNFSAIDENAIAYIDGEVVVVKSWTDTSLTVARGVLDTVPKAHNSGVRIWIAGTIDQGFDNTEYLENETVTCKVLTKTAKGTLAVAAAPTVSTQLRARAFRPYPPGRLLINGAYFPANTSGALVLSWYHRDRLQQTSAVFIEQVAQHVGPEVGVTYTLRLYGETNVLKKTVTGLTGTTYTWDTEIADSGLGRLNTSVRIELEAVRDGYTSWTKWDVTVARP